jgi:hypothetical protein
VADYKASDPTKLRCDNCGFMNVDGSKVCAHCNAKISPKKTGRNWVIGILVLMAYLAATQFSWRADEARKSAENVPASQLPTAVGTGEQQANSATPIVTTADRKTDPVNGGCPSGKPSGKSMSVIGESVSLRFGPGAKFDRVKNQKNAEGSPYANLDNSMTVNEVCRDGEWSLVETTSPEWLRHTHTGWVANKYLREPNTGQPNSAPQVSASRTPSNAMICKATIATVMGRSLQSISVIGNQDGRVSVGYRREDGLPFAYNCKFDGNRVVWATSPNGRWRDGQDDSKISFKTSADNLVITETFPDYSQSTKSFPIGP